MRTETRLVLGWLIGRPDGWEVRVKHVQHILGLSRDRWSKSRKEMEQYGYLRQIRKKNGDGTFRWEHFVTDTPSPSEDAIAGKSNDGEASTGKPGDITPSIKQQEFSTPLNPPWGISQACYEEARNSFRGYDVDHLEGTWKEWASGKIEPPKNPDRAFLAWARTYTKNHPLPFGGEFGLT